MQKVRTYDEWMEVERARLRTNMDFEAVIAKMTWQSKDRKIEYPGYCEVCNEEVGFIITDAAAENGRINYRENMVCPKCRLNNRQRIMAALILNTEKIDEKQIYMYEQITPFFRTMKPRIKNLIGSEYFGDTVIPGTISENGIRHEDAMNLSFDNESIDLIISNDVFEHVADIEKTFMEAYRVLKRGGKMYISVPFYFAFQKTVKRAAIVNGKLEHYEPIVYHGNPMSKEGSLVFYDHGWELIDIIKNCGFSDAYFSTFYDVRLGHVGWIPYVLFVEK